MSLNIYDHFEYNEKLGVYDFTKEKLSINKLRELPYVKEIPVDNIPITIISFMQYGNVELWWIIAVYNNIIDAKNITSATLKIPSLNEVRRVLR